MNKNYLNTIIITTNFPPIEGGIQTYMLQIARHWNIGKVYVNCNLELNEPNYQDKPFMIERYKETLVPFKLGLNEVIKILFMNKKNWFLALNFFCYLLYNRHALRSSIYRTKKLILYIKKNNSFTVLQASTPIINGVIGMFCKILFNFPLITYVHGAELLIYRKRVNRKLLAKFIMNNSDIVFANSNYTKQLALDFGVKKNKIRIMHLGANTDRFYPKSTKKKIIKRHNIPLDNKLLLSVSHLIPRKGNDKVIEALFHVLKCYSRVTYIIVGKGDYENHLKELVKKYKIENNVVFAGLYFGTDIADYMNACDIFIMPSRLIDKTDVEGFGIVFLEANACKKPVIGGNSGGIPDAIINRVTGYLVNPESIEDITEKILILLNDEEKATTLGENGYKRVQEELNWDMVIKKIKTIIQSLINERSYL